MSIGSYAGAAGVRPLEGRLRIRVSDADGHVYRDFIPVSRSGPYYLMQPYVEAADNLREFDQLQARLVLQGVRVEIETTLPSLPLVSVAIATYRQGVYPHNPCP